MPLYYWFCAIFVSVATFFALESIVPVYANAATTRATRRLAEERLGSDLAEISVETFEGTPIIEIKARDPEQFTRNKGEVGWWWRDLSDHPKFKELFGLN